MITAVVKFKIPPDMTREKMLEHNKRAVARYQNVPGLLQKQFLYSDEGFAGGVYLWESREAAEACYRGPWRDNLRKVAITEPEITWFDAQVVVDNETHAVKGAA
jgi:Putative mono-oxygenase ydhR